MRKSVLKLVLHKRFETGMRIKVASCTERRMPMILLDYKDRRPIFTNRVVSKFEELSMLLRRCERE